MQVPISILMASFLSNNEIKLKYDALETYASVIEKPEDEERNLFISTILKDTCGQELLSILNKNQDWKGLTTFYQLINFLEAQSRNESFKLILKYIRRLIFLNLFFIMFNFLLVEQKK